MASEEGAEAKAAYVDVDDALDEPSARVEAVPRPTRTRDQEDLLVLIRKSSPPVVEPGDYAASVRAASKFVSTKATKVGKWTLRKDHSVVRAVEVALIVALAYAAVATPVEVAFFVERRKTVTDFFFVANTAANAVFLTDMGLQFFTHYDIRRNRTRRDVVKDHPSIIRHYLRGHFLLDLISSFPYDVLALLATESHAAVRKLATLRLLRLVRLARLLRAADVGFVSRYRADIDVSFAVANLGRYLVLTVVVAHYFACLWGYVGNASSRNNSWRTPFLRGAHFSIDTPKNQYLLALYFAIYTLTTVGYGDITPSNLSEYAVVALCMFAGGFFWAYIIGCVCSSVTNLDRVKIQNQCRYDQINAMLLDVAAPKDVARQVRRYLFQTESLSRHVEYAALMDHLSPGLQRDLVAQVFPDGVHYFRGRSANFKLAIFKSLKTRLFCPEELIDTPDLVVITNAGVVKHDERNGLFPRLYVSGQALNLDFLLRNDDLREDHVFKAATYVEVNTLSRWDLDDVIVKFPRERPRLLWMHVFYALRNALRRLKRKSSHSLADAITSSSNHGGLSPPALLRRTTSAAVLDTILALRGGGDDGAEVARVDSFDEAVAACRDGHLDRLAPDLADVPRLVDLAVAANPSSFRFASPRLRADPDVILRALRACSRDNWKRLVFPHVEPASLRLLLDDLCDGRRAITQ